MAQGKFQVTPEMMNRFAENTLVSTLGIEYLEPVDGCMRARMPVDRRTCQPQGLLHGGASVALAETLGSTASFFLIDPETQYCVGLEINANHLRPMREGYVEAIARPIHVGRSTHIWDIRISDENERLVCVSRLTVAVREKKPHQD